MEGGGSGGRIAGVVVFFVVVLALIIAGVILLGKGGGIFSGGGGKPGDECCTDAVYAYDTHYTINGQDKQICSPFDGLPTRANYQCDGVPLYTDDALCDSYGTVPDAGSFTIGGSKNSYKGKYVGCHWAEKAGARDRFCWGGKNSKMGGGTGGCTESKYPLWTGISYATAARNGKLAGGYSDTPLCMKDISSTCS